MIKFSYDTNEYDFKPLFCEWLDTNDLTKLHNQKKYPVLTREADMYMHWNQIYYKRWREDSSIKELYLKFLETVIKPRFGEEIIYQELPDIRIHLPENLAVGDAKISKKHCNFFVNKNNASFDDMNKLIKFVQDSVQKKTGIILEKEIKILE